MIVFMWIIIAVIILLIICIIIYKSQARNGPVSKVAYFLFTITSVIGLVTYLTNPSKIIDEILDWFPTSGQKKEEQVKPSPPFTVTFPEKTIINTEDVSNIDLDNTESEYIVQPVFLNIHNEMVRDNQGFIFIEWTPIKNNLGYTLYLSLDDPFQQYNLNQDIFVEDNWYNLDANEFPLDTLVFISVATNRKNGVESELETLNFKIVN